MKHHPEITDSMVEIFISIILGGDYNRQLAVRLIRKLDSVSKRDLRMACHHLYQLIEDIRVEEIREGRIDRRERAKFARLERAIRGTFGRKS